MSTLAIVLIVFGVIVLIAVILGSLGARARDRRQAAHWEDHVRAADSALAHAAASDRGWARDIMEQAVRDALAEGRPGWDYGPLHLILVDDRPGTEKDRAHFVAVGDAGDEARVVLSRQGDRWVAESID